MQNKPMSIFVCEHHDLRCTFIHQNLPSCCGNALDQISILLQRSSWCSLLLFLWEAMDGCTLWIFIEWDVNIPKPRDPRVWKQDIVALNNSKHKSPLNVLEEVSVQLERSPSCSPLLFLWKVMDGETLWNETSTFNNQRIPECESNTSWH